MPKIISVVNQKGGVGKTTTVINLGASLATLGKKVLLIDLDPQGNLSSGLNISSRDIANKNMYSVLVGLTTVAQNIVPTDIEGLSVVPADPNLAGAEVEMVDMERREFRLKDKVAGLDAFDYIFIDCPPSLGLLTLNALTASDSYLVPMQSEYFALQGLTHILKTTKLVKTYLNPRLVEEGILLTMFDSRSNLAKQVYNEVVGYAKERLFKTVIPRRVRLAESASHGKPGMVYDPTCFGARSYVDAAQEFIARNSGKAIEAPKADFVPPDPVDRVPAEEDRARAAAKNQAELERLAKQASQTNAPSPDIQA